jgi:hypothetical protein
VIVELLAGEVLERLCDRDESNRQVHRIVDAFASGGEHEVVEQVVEEADITDP